MIFAISFSSREYSLNDTSFILLEGFNQRTLFINPLLYDIKEQRNSILFLCCGDIYGHCKKSVILDTHPIMPCTAVTGHIDIPMPCRRTEVPFKIQRIDLLLCSETQVQWGHYSCFWIFITAYGTVGRIGRFPGIINKIICLDDIVPTCIVAVCDVLIKIVTLRNKPLLC